MEEPPPVESAKLDLSEQLTSIAMGSCNRQNNPQDYWPFIADQNPDLWIWLGDNIYADTENMDAMAAMYDRQFTNEYYQDFRAAIPILGLWDDHDYGVNDGDYRYPKKEESKELMLDFLEVADDAPVRSRAGTYQSYLVGPSGKRVKIILLDARWFREELQPDDPNGNRYHPNPDGLLLGEEQWTWLEEELGMDDAEVYLIGSGIQILPEEQFFEKWANFPTARQRLLDLLVSSRAADQKQVVLLSGDRHISELSKIELNGLSQPVYELTSSGLTHSYLAADEPNAYRQGPLVVVRSFGVLQIDWDTQPAQLKAEILSISGELLYEHVLE